MISIFWICLFTVFYTFLGYGCLLFVLAKTKMFLAGPRVLNSGSSKLPSVTLVTAAYNEKDIICQKIENCRSLDYPPELLRFIFVTDGSSDGTPGLIKQTPGMEVMHLPERKGKVAAINRAMEQVRSEITVFTDANAMLNREAVRRLVRHYEDRRAGAVAGEKRINPGADAGSKGEGLYWKYESALKKLDYELYTNVGAAGELFSIRTPLYEKLPGDTIVDDHMLAMSIAERGWIVAYEPDAFSYENSSMDTSSELERRIRICAGGIQSILRLKRAPNPLLNPVLAFQYISHRVLRWAVAPLLLPVIFFLNILICLNEAQPVLYQYLLGGQILFYSLALAGSYLSKKTGLAHKTTWLPCYFCLMNYAALAGTVRYFLKRQSAAWKKAARKDPAVAESPAKARQTRAIFQGIFVNPGLTSVNHRILSAILNIGFLSLFVKMAALAREIVTARQFGATPEVDAYIMASIIPISVVLFFTYSFGPAFVPIYFKVREQNRQSTRQLVESAMFLSLGLLAATALSLAFLSGIYLPILCSGFTPQALAFTGALLKVTIPVIVFGGCASLFVSILNAEERFSVTSLTPAVTPLVSIAFVLLSGSSIGTKALAFGLLFGSVLELLILAFSMKAIKGALWPRWHGMSEPLRQAIRQYGVLLAGAVVTCSVPVIDQAMTASLTHGSVAQLGYGTKIPWAISALGMAVVGTSIFPHFSRMMARGEWSNVQGTYLTWIKRLLPLTFAGSVVIFCFSPEITELFLQRGSFTASDTATVSVIQRFAVIGIPFSIISVLAIQFLTARGAGKVLLQISIINMAAHIVGNYLLMGWMGAAGIALSSSLARLIVFGLLTSALVNVWHDKREPEKEQTEPQRHRDTEEEFF